MKMKLLIALLFTTQLVVSQNFQTVEEVDEVCASLGFASNEEAELVVDEIMNEIGVPRPFIIRECPQINNAIAKVLTNNKGIQTQYILYDRAFMNRMKDKTKTDWSAKGILAHEIGHHLASHSLNNKGSNHKFELEADEFSGVALAKLGATLKEAQSAINSLKYEKATATHPAKKDRLSAIKKGWLKATKGNSKITDFTDDIDFLKAGKFFREANESFMKQNFTEAIRFNKKAAELGHSGAMAALATSHLNGFGVERDFSKAYKWAKLSVEQKQQDTSAGMVVLSNLYQLGGGVEPSLELAFYWAKKAYDEYNNSTSMGMLADMYAYGNGVDRDHDKAFSLAKKSADLNDSNGMITLGLFYDLGIGTDKDHEKALMFYRKAAELNHPSSMSNIGQAYFYGNGTSKNYDKAIEWFKKGAELGDPQSFYWLGYMYLNGEGLDKDINQSIFWFQKGVDSNNTWSMMQLATIYMSGNEIPYDIPRCIKLITRCAELNDYACINTLAFLYINGFPGHFDIDREKGINLLKKLAVKNDLTAQQTLTKLGETW